MTCIKLADISESILAHHLNTGKGSENPSPIVLGVLFEGARVDRRWVKRRDKCVMTEARIGSKTGRVQNMCCFGLCQPYEWFQGVS